MELNARGGGPKEMGKPIVSSERRVGFSMQVEVVGYCHALDR